MLHPDQDIMSPSTSHAQRPRHCLKTAKQPHLPCRLSRETLGTEEPFRLPALRTSCQSCIHSPDLVFPTQAYHTDGTLLNNYVEKGHDFWRTTMEGRRKVDKPQSHPLSVRMYNKYKYNKPRKKVTKKRITSTYANRNRLNLLNRR